MPIATRGESPDVGSRLEPVQRDAVRLFGHTNGADVDATAADARASRAAARTAPGGACWSSPSWR